MITPVKQYTFQFVADGTSNSLAIDASLNPINEEFRGSFPVAVLLPVVTSGYTGVLTGVTATLSGSTVTFSFTTPPAKLDNNSNLIVYTATFYLQYQT